MRWSRTSSFDFPMATTARLVPRVDRLTIDEGYVEEVHGEDDAVEMPDDELLRLDDGTPLPVELAELRSLLELHSLAGATDEDDMIAVDDASGRKLLDEIAAAKADALRDCLLGFDEGILLLHDKLLDHEAMCKRLDAMRRRKRIMPAGRNRYDEAVAVIDEDDDGSGGPEDSELELGAMLSMDAPAGATEAPGRSRLGGNGEHLAAEPAEPADDNEEALDQRVASSRQQIKAWVRALEEGKRERAPQGSALGGVRGLNCVGSIAVLPPVVPPPRARQSSYSQRLRLNAARYSQGGF